jgi:acyl-CoA synthetase (AMP-forming)/AMP-acid ligase II
MRSLVEASRVLTGTLRFPPGAGVIAAVPLDRSYGMNNGLMAAAVLGRPLGLIERFDHTQFLALCDSGAYWYWAGTPVMADILSRSRPTVSSTVPPMCGFAGRLSTPVVRAFEARFSTPLRNMYATTETLTISLDSASPADVRHEMAGWPLPDVRVAIGDDPHHPEGAGVAGRIWVKSRWLMEGYGFPPDLEPSRTVDGWWATPDVGRVDADGRLMLIGRLDDRIRTGAGHVVDPGEVAAALEGYPGVTESAVVPIDTAVGPAICALVEVEVPIRSIDLRNHLAGLLPAWARPRAVETVARLPRLASGRVDRRACIELLADCIPSQNPT